MAFELKALISANSSRLVSELRKSRKAIARYKDQSQEAGRQSASAFMRADRSAAQLAKTTTKLAAAMTAATGAIGAKAVKDFVSFEKAFAQVRTLVDESKVDVKSLEKGVKGLASTYGQDLNKSVTAAYQAISAGVQPARTVSFLDTAFKAAAAGATTAETATDLLTTALNAYQKPVSEASRISDVFFTVIKEGKTTAAELSSNLGKVAATAASAGVSLEETGAALATLTKAGLSTEEATTRLGAVLSEIVKPSAQASGALKRIGVTAEELKRVGLVEVMRRLGRATKGSATEINKLFANRRSVGGVTILAGKLRQEFERIAVATKSAAGATDEAFSKVAETVDFKLSRAIQSAKVALVDLGERLKPALEAAIRFGEDAIAALDGLGKSLSENLPRALGSFEAKSVSATKVVVTGAKTVEAVFFAVGKAVRALATPIAAVRAAAEGLANLTTAALTATVAAATKAVEVLFRATSAAATGLRTVIEGVKSGLDLIVTSPESKFGRLSASLGGVAERLKGIEAGIDKSAARLKDFGTGAATTTGLLIKKVTETKKVFDDTKSSVEEVAKTVEKVEDAFRRGAKAAADAGAASRAAAQETESGWDKAGKSVRAAVEEVKAFSGGSRAAAEELKRLGIQQQAFTTTAKTASSTTVSLRQALLNLRLPRELAKQFDETLESQRKNKAAADKVAAALSSYNLPPALLSQIQQAVAGLDRLGKKADATKKKVQAVGGGVQIGGASGSGGGFTNERFVVTSSGLRPLKSDGSIDFSRTIGARPTGGVIPQTGPFRLEKGEGVLNQGGMERLYALLLDRLNAPGAPTVNQTINVSGAGSLRDQARALLPELERATRRGMTGKGAFA